MIGRISPTHLYWYAAPFNADQSEF